MFSRKSVKMKTSSKSIRKEEFRTPPSRKLSRPKSRARPEKQNYRISGHVEASVPDRNRVPTRKVFRKAPPRNHNFVLSIEAIKGSVLLIDFSQSKFFTFGFFKMKIFAAISSFGAVLGDDNLNLGVDPLKKSIFLKDIARESTELLKQHMDLDGLNFEDYIDDAIDIYRSDFPEKAILFDDLAEQNIQIENNEIQRVGGRMSGLSPMDQYHVMKYLQLKYLTLYLQKDKFMGKFCFYGCWCFPRAAGAQWSGYGVPVDNIDKSCREFTTCYNCIFNQQLIGQRCDESNPVRYNIGGSQNVETGEITIFCKDPQGTCERSRCECDKDLALKLQRYESEWSIQNHHHWGQPRFNPQVTCSYNVNQFLQDDPEQQQTLTYAVVSQINPGALVETNVPADPTKLKLDGLISQESGARPDMTLYKPRGLPTYGPIIGCCGRAPHVHFFRKGQRCCQDGEIVDERFPCSMDFE